MEGLRREGARCWELPSATGDGSQLTPPIGRRFPLRTEACRPVQRPVPDRSRRPFLIVDRTWAKITPPINAAPTPNQERWLFGSAGGCGTVSPTRLV
jgi:hypothetical protein